MRFLLVDRILELDPNKKIVAIKHINRDEDYFPDHFPGFPVVPGVLQVEMMAQAAGKCLMAGIDASRWPVLIQVRQANFRKSVLPDSSLRIEAEILSSGSTTAIASGKIWCDGQIVADATIVFGFIEKGLLQPGFEDETLSAFLQQAKNSSQS